MFLDDAQREGDLVAEIDRAQLALEALEANDGLGQLEPLARRVVRAVAHRDRAQLLQPRRDELDDVLGGDPVVGGLFGQLEYLGDHGGLPLGRNETKRHLVQDAAAQLGALRRRQDALSGLDSGQQAVPLDDLGGEAMVVEDGGLLALSQVEGQERAAHPHGQVLGRLVGERQAQHVSRQHAGVAGVHASQCHQGEIHDAGRHDGRLSRAGTRHDNARLERHRDGRPLFGRGFGAQGGDDLGRVALAHDAASTGRTGCPSE